MSRTYTHYHQYIKLPHPNTPLPETNRFCDRLWWLMETHGDSALKVATQVGVCSHTIYKYLSGEVEPKAFVLTALSDIYDVSTDFLLGLTNEPKRSGYNGSA